MKKIQFGILVILVCFALTEGCKKDSTDDSPTPTPAANVICDGNGTTDFLPLVLNNSWYYSATGNSFTLTVSGTATYSSKTYFEVTTNLGGELLLRKATNGDIMAYHTSSGTEQLYIPVAPTVGQTWNCDVEGTGTRKVLSVSASLTTSSCSYTGCLKIQNTSASGTPGRTVYYKKGVGMVSTDQIWPGAIVTNLSTVTLH